MDYIQYKWILESACKINIFKMLLWKHYLLETFPFKLKSITKRLKTYNERALRLLKKQYVSLILG